MDVKSNFLNWHLEEEVYVEQTIVGIYIYIYGHENKVPKLKITLYGIKQTLRAWNNRIDQYFHDNNFVWYLYEHALCIKVNEKSDILLVGLDVNCLIFIGTNPIMFSEFKEVIG